jgi:hypothetical protein
VTRAGVRGEPLRDRSRPYVDEAGQPSNGQFSFQQHAVCLESGERFVLNAEARTGPRTGPTVETLITFVAPDGSYITDGVEVTFESLFQGQTSVSTQTSDADAAVRLVTSPFGGGCFTILDAEHPVYDFPGLVGASTCVGTLTNRFVAVGQAQGQPAVPARLTIDLASAADSTPLWDVQVAHADTGWVVYRDAFVDSGTSLEAELGAGCYAVRLWLRDDVLMTEVSRAVRSFDVCLGVGEAETVASGELAAANVDGSQPFLPIEVVDTAGGPVAGVQVDLFYPRADLTADELRLVDHGAEDARGVYFDSAVTDTGGRALVPNYSECMVATLIAPTGFTFDGGAAFDQRTVCEGDRIAAVVTADPSMGCGPMPAGGGAPLSSAASLAAVLGPGLALTRRRFAGH